MPTPSRDHTAHGGRVGGVGVTERGSRGKGRGKKEESWAPLDYDNPKKRSGRVPVGKITKTEREDRV